MRRLEDLRYRKSRNMAFNVYFEEKKYFSNNVLPELQNKGPIFRNSLLLEIFQKDENTSKNFLEPIIRDFKFAAVLRQIVSRQPYQSANISSEVINLPPFNPIVADDSSNSWFSLKNIFFAAVSRVAEKETKKNLKIFFLTSARV